MSRQGVLPLSLPPVYSEANFHVAACNRDAHAWVMRWPDWPSHALLIYGPSGCGKTHLGHIWAARADAQTASPLSPAAMHENWLVEDIERIDDQSGLLHAINYSRENGAYLLLTSAVAPKQLPFDLPDLTSRLLALPCAAIAPPDDAVMEAALRKQFTDRQLKIQEDAIAFLLPRMERSFTQVAETVDWLDKQALAEQRNLSVPFIKRVLGY